MDIVPGSIACGGCTFSNNGSRLFFTFSGWTAGNPMPTITYQAAVKQSVNNANIPNTAIASAANNAYNGDGCRDTDGNLLN